MARIVSFFNHKGGVGKTTTVHNLACALRSLGKRVLVVDSDPQMNLTAKIYGFSTNTEYTEQLGSQWRQYSQEYTSLDKIFYDIFRNESRGVNVYKQQNGNNCGCLHIVPSSFNLASLEADIVDIIKRNNQLDKGKMYHVEKFFRENLGTNYDFILIDFSPSASSLINALLMLMSDFFIIPTSPTIFCLQAIENLENVFKNWSESLSAHKQTHTDIGLSYHPKFLGIIISLVKRTTTKGETHPTSGTREWMKLVNSRIKNFYTYAVDVDRSITEDQFKKFFPKHSPFIIDISYDFTLELRTRAEQLGKSEFDLKIEELPKTPASKRTDKNGNEIYVHQYTETLNLIKETYSYIAEGLIRLIDN